MAESDDEVRARQQEAVRRDVENQRIRAVEAARKAREAAERAAKKK